MVAREKSIGFHVSLMLRIIVDRQPNSFAGRTVGVARRDLKFGVRDNGGNDLKSFSEIRSDKLGTGVDIQPSQS
jgi:hypothetical protein